MNDGRRNASEIEHHFHASQLFLAGPSFSLTKRERERGTASSLLSSFEAQRIFKEIPPCARRRRPRQRGAGVVAKGTTQCVVVFPSGGGGMLAGEQGERASESWPRESRGPARPLSALRYRRGLSCSRCYPRGTVDASKWARKAECCEREWGRNVALPACERAKRA